MVKRNEGDDFRIEGGVIDGLRQRLRGSVILAGDPGYDEARRVWNGMVDRRPAMIVLCRGAADVMACVDFARTWGLALAVRGGGHNVAGKALADGALVIDLREMRAVRVDPEKRVATVEGGATLRDVDHETHAFGLAAPLGVVSATGVGGLTLHGGYGWLSRRHGLSIDNLMAVDIVTADGRLRHASPTEHSDLFWAVRGGGGDFGVVTAFEFRLHPVGPRVWQGLTVHPLDRAVDALRLFRAYMATAPEELGALAVLWSAPEEAPVPLAARGKPALIFLSCYSGPPERGEEVLRPFRELGEPLADLTRQTTFPAMQQALDPDYPAGRRYYWKSTYLKELSDGAIDVLVAHGADRPSALSSIDVWALGGAIARIAPDATPFGMRSAPNMIGIEANWNDPAQSDANIAWARHLFAELKPFSSGAGYLNFPGLYEEGVTGSFGANFQRLAAIKRRHDPGNLFHGALAHV